MKLGQQLVAGVVSTTFIIGGVVLSASAQTYKSFELCDLNYSPIEQKTGGQVEEFTVKIWGEREKRTNVTAQEVLDSSWTTVRKRGNVGIVNWQKDFQTKPTQDQAVCLSKTLLLDEGGFVHNGVRYKVELRWDGKV